MGGGGRERAQAQAWKEAWGRNREGEVPPKGHRTPPQSDSQKNGQSGGPLRPWATPARRRAAPTATPPPPLPSPSPVRTGARGAQPMAHPPHYAMRRVVAHRGGGAAHGGRAAAHGGGGARRPPGTAPMTPATGRRGGTGRQAKVVTTPPRPSKKGCQPDPPGHDGITVPVTGTWPTPPSPPPPVCSEMVGRCLPHPLSSPPVPHSESYPALSLARHPTWTPPPLAIPLAPSLAAPILSLGAPPHTLHPTPPHLGHPPPSIPIQPGSHQSTSPPPPSPELPALPHPPNNAPAQ